ncbi:winged helix-turn-helix domain-containing protein [Yersinia phage vB_YenM_636]|nr:hypothetical protein X1_07 [Yersinia phage vB_Yen_X1]QKN86302.1 winged helix-turn-helix domain-containing protein [Yersinia phage vB_YenM_12]QKN86393.1 winged helix-turn-helix domain-containing protein [Yersinia phage vB_YenM_22]QKN86484.1 winged helix-turn-helix domain-containing protein [Yersinia phage vB_YenM_25]QKN86575.1 winged helix-turn-helix domain-containing protein [Yersinia phage vB_YenM_27]QKN86666.1 winged helix-turn-helix domain-containing protein [Yersinia phage vB_YenM_39]Q
MARTQKITDEQLIKELEAGKKVPQIAKEYNMNERNVWARKAKLARDGYAPTIGVNVELPTGYKLGKVTTAADANGNIERVWFRSAPEYEEMLKALREAVEEYKEQVPAAKVLPYKVGGDDNLLNFYAIADYHLSMLAWAEESGENWDSKISEELLVRWFKTAVEKAPDAKTGYLADLGDFMHFDGMAPVTPASKHLLDADIRFPRTVRTAIRVMKAVVEILLKKHEKVIVDFTTGNHNESSAVWMRELFDMHYKDHPRVKVNTSPAVYHAHKHGKVAIFTHHGHKANMKKVDSVCAGTFPELFGATKYRYVHIGHFHHIEKVESNLMVIEMHRTLAAKDAYAANGGWLSGRSADVITYHKEYGEVSRLTITPWMVGMNDVGTFDANDKPVNHITES